MPRRRPAACHRRLAAAVGVAALLAAPAAAQAVLVVETDPPGAVVSVDGEVIGEAPVRVEVAAGRHTVEARRGRFGTAAESVEVAAGDTLRLVLRLPRQTGRVRVEGLPEGAEVETPGWSLEGAVGEAATGRRRLEVRTPDGARLSARVPVEAGAETVVRYRADATAPGRVALNAVLPGSAQMRGGRPAVGALYAAGVGAGVVLTALQVEVASDAEADYQTAVGRYELAASEGRALAAWADVEAEYARSLDAHRRLRTVALAGLAVYAASLADAALFHLRQPRLDVGAPARPTAWELAPSADGVALRLRF